MMVQQLQRLMVSTVVVAIISLATTTTTFCYGFQTPTILNNKASKRSLPSSLNVLPPLSVDPSDVTLQVTALHQAVIAAASSSSSSTGSSSFQDFFQTLSDATAATAAAAAADEGGWWNAYLNIFKSALLLVHDTIDGPLRSVGWTQTWGVSIALFTAGVRSMLIPLSVQQSKSSEYIKALRPYVSEIKEKFANNPEAQNRALGKLYEDANQNPLSGCLFSLAQLPIFLGLYRGVRLLARDGVLDEPFLWIPSLQGPVTAESNYQGLDWLTQNWQTVDGILTPSLGWPTTLAFCIMPVLLVVGQSLTMRVLQPPVDENASEQEREQLEKTQGILKFLPLMIGFFSLQVPAGLTIYWFTSNGFTLTQSLAVRKYYQANPPKIELPDYWDSLDNMDAMTVEEKRQAAKAGIAIGPTMEDLLAESKFHTVVERGPLRADSDAWNRVMASFPEGGATIPAEMQAWVREDHETTHGSASALNGSSAQTREGEVTAAVAQVSSA